MTEYFEPAEEKPTMTMHEFIAKNHITSSYEPAESNPNLFPCIGDKWAKEKPEMMPRGFKCLNKNHENGRYYYSEERDISVFEDNQLSEDRLRYYAWSGGCEQHDVAEHTPVYNDFLQAVCMALGMRSIREAGK